MSSLTSTLKVVVNASGATSGAAQVANAIQAMSSKATTAFSQMNSHLSSINSLLDRTSSSAKNFIAQFLSFEVIKSFSKSIAEASREYSAFMAISKVTQGSLQKAGESFDYIKDLSNTLGVSLEANIKTFGKFSAAMKPMDADGSLTKHLFEGISIAAGGLHLNAQAVERSFLALEQAASKNKPTLEEFQRQLAEHIPGAMAYLAEGVGLRMDQIHNAISNGTVSIKDLMTGLANVLKQKFGDAAEYAAKQLPAAINRMKNALFEFKVEVSKAGAAKGLSDIADAISDLLKKGDVTKALGEIFKDVGASLSAFIRSITAEDVQNVSKGIQTISKILVEFVSNIGLIFKTVFGAIILQNVARLASSILVIGANASTAATGVGVLRVALIAASSTMFGPLGIIAGIGAIIYGVVKLREESAKPINIITKITQETDNIKNGESPADPMGRLKSIAAEVNMLNGAIGRIQAKDSSGSMTGSEYLEMNRYIKVRNALLEQQKAIAIDLRKANASSEIEALRNQVSLPGNTGIAGMFDPEKFQSQLSKAFDKKPLDKFLEDFKDTRVNIETEYRKLVASFSSSPIDKASGLDIMAELSKGRSALSRNDAVGVQISTERSKEMLTSLAKNPDAASYEKSYYASQIRDFELSVVSAQEAILKSTDEAMQHYRDKLSKDVTELQVNIDGDALILQVKDAFKKAEGEISRNPLEIPVILMPSISSKGNVSVDLSKSSLKLGGR